MGVDNRRRLNPLTEPARIPPSATPAIRRATPADAPTLAVLGARTFTETFGHLYPPQDLADFLAEAYGQPRIEGDLADPGTAVWLAEAAGRPVGYVRAGGCALPHPDVTADCGEIKSLYLLGETQGGGLGGRLLTTAMGWLADRGHRAVWLGVWENNLGAQRFYRRRGFEPVGDYGFKVGATVDRELIYRCVPESHRGEIF